MPRQGAAPPFLATLERIEVVDDHLVINGIRLLEPDGPLHGVPQFRTAGYDARRYWKYLRTRRRVGTTSLESHFQHLDVKPENLLLVGRHIKVGDFGLLKQLQAATPASTASHPATHRPKCSTAGRAWRSDQYSLAIVYQEMATGRLPFDRRLAAALASQHMQSPPGLWGLTPQERFAVGKALSKVPDRRFASCREFAARRPGPNPATMFTAGRNTPGTAAMSAASPPNNEPRCRDGNRPVPGRPAPALIHDVQTISLDNAATTAPSCAVARRDESDLPSHGLHRNWRHGRKSRLPSAAVADRLFRRRGVLPRLAVPMDRLTWRRSSDASLKSSWTTVCGGQRGRPPSRPGTIATRRWDALHLKQLCLLGLPRYSSFSSHRRNKVAGPDGPLGPRRRARRIAPRPAPPAAV